MKKTVLSAVAFVLLLGYSAVSQTQARAKHRIVFQVSEPDTAASLILHVNNTIGALGEDGGTEVEVVFFGLGLGTLAKTNVAYSEQLKQLSDRGVRLLACRNAMKMRNLTTADLFPFAGQVDSGVAEIVRRQEAGWSYIH